MIELAFLLILNIWHALNEAHSKTSDANTCSHKLKDIGLTVSQRSELHVLLPATQARTHIVTAAQKSENFANSGLFALTQPLELLAPRIQS
jgi:hypothetical protein